MKKKYLSEIIAGSVWRKPLLILVSMYEVSMYVYSSALLGRPFMNGRAHLDFEGPQSHKNPLNSGNVN